MSDLHRIGEAARITGLSAGTLRNYEIEKLISPLRNKAGDRMYTDELLEEIKEIKIQKAANWIRHRKDEEE